MKGQEQMHPRRRTVFVRGRGDNFRIGQETLLGGGHPRPLKVRSIQSKQETSSHCLRPIMCCSDCHLLFNNVRSVEEGVEYKGHKHSRLALSGMPRFLGGLGQVRGTCDNSTRAWDWTE